MIYIASPYTHKSREVEHKRFLAAQEITAKALIAGHHVYSPIVHNHELNRVHGMPTDAIFWKAYNTAFLRLASQLWIITIEGWTDSKGVLYERDLAHRLNIPCSLISPDANFVGTEFL